MSRAIEILNDDEMNWVRDDDEGFGSLRTSRGMLPLTHLDVHANICGVFARTVVEQTFINNFDEPLEATYIFPLPDRAAVSAFRLDVAGRSVVGDLKERGQARRQYDQAIQSGHRAAIAEEERPGVFTMRVGNIMPGERARVRLELVGQLATRGDEATFRFPLVVAPRYMPGRPLGDDVGDGVAADTEHVPDASRISPPVLLEGYPNPVHLSLSVDIDPSGIPIRSVRSSLHAVVVDTDAFGDGVVERIRVVPGERLNRDFILRFTLGQDAVGTGLRIEPDDDSSDRGTFSLTIVPPRRDSIVRTPRDVVFVLDRSGSMQGWKMPSARRAVARMIDSLDYDDHFAVLAFDNVIDTPQRHGQKLLRATDRNRYRAVRFLDDITARGGTEMMEPLRKATQLLRNHNHERIVVLVTDGQVGNESQIVSLFQEKLHGSRVFTIGIDRAVNAGFLKRLANLGGGGCELVEDETRLDEVMESIHRRIDTPIWKKLSLSASGFRIDPDSIAPCRMPDVFAGNPVVVTGRYEGDAQGASIEIRAEQQDGHHLKQDVFAKRTEQNLIRKVWARARIRDLEDKYDASGKRNHAKEIMELSLAHGVMCRFTSFVAIDHAEVVNEGGRQHKVVQAVEQPEGARQATQSRRRQRNEFAAPPPSPTMPSPALRSPISRPASFSAASVPGGRSSREEVTIDYMGVEDIDDDDFEMQTEESMDEIAPLEVSRNQAFAPAPGGRAPEPKSAPSKGKSKRRAKPGPLGRIVDAGRAIISSKKVDANSSAEGPTTRGDVESMWRAFTSPKAQGVSKTMLRLEALLSSLNAAISRAFEALSVREQEALDELAVAIDAILARGDLVSDKDVKEFTTHVAQTLEAIAFDRPLPAATSSRKVERGEEFWR